VGSVVLLDIVLVCVVPLMLAQGRDIDSGVPVGVVIVVVEVMYDI